MKKTTRFHEINTGGCWTGYRMPDVGYRFGLQSCILIISRGNLCNLVVTNTGKRGDMKKWECWKV